MAIRFATQVDNIMFSSALRVVAVATEGETSVLFSISHAGIVIFYNTYIPDDSGMVHIYDIDRILDNYITDVHATFTLSVADETLTIVVFKCSTQVDIPATEFVENYFLTPHTRKTTTLYRDEGLSIYNPTDEAVDVIATCDYYNNGEMSQQTQTVGSAPSGLSAFEVSPALFVSPKLGQLMGYTITAGNRVKTFDVRRHKPDAVGVAYKNAFGVWEHFYFEGLLQTEMDYTRAHAVIGGRLVPYDVQEVQSFKANTGPIPWGEEIYVYDLCRSLSVNLLNPQGTSEEIVVTDSEVKSNNAQDAISDFVVTFRRADRLTSKITTPKSVELFDDTFDDTFN